MTYRMEYRYLGKSGLKVPALSFGAATFGGEGALFGAMGDTDVEEAKKLIDVCLEHGCNMFDTADVYSMGRSEEILGAALKGRREDVLISTKTTLPLSRKPNMSGSSRYRLVKAVDDALKRLDTDYIDLLYLHAFDSFTPMEEVLSTLDQLIRDGKLRYIGVSNYSGWQLMKSLGISEKYGWAKYVAHQVHYSLVTRDYEWELMPLALDQGVGGMVWSPLGWGRLAGKIRRGQKPPEGSRMATAAEWATPVDEEQLFNVIDVMDEISADTGKSLPQIAIRWLLQRPSISSVIMGARNERQLRDNLGAIGWELTAEQVKKLDEASYVVPAYPYFSYHIEKSYKMINPPAV